MGNTFKDGDGILGVVVLARKTRGQPGANRITKLCCRDRTEPLTDTDTMSTSEIRAAGGATAKPSWSWQAAVDAELSKTPSDETAVEVWRLRCKEATSAFLQGECLVLLLGPDPPLLTPFAFKKSR